MDTWVLHLHSHVKQIVDKHDEQICNILHKYGKIQHDYAPPHTQVLLFTYFMCVVLHKFHMYLHV